MISLNTEGFDRLKDAISKEQLFIIAKKQLLAKIAGIDDKRIGDYKFELIENESGGLNILFPEETPDDLRAKINAVWIKAQGQE